MQLLNIFKKRKNAPIDRTLFYHEDDYCQVELSPKENLAYFLKEAEEIDALADQNFDGYGYTDIYVRQDNRIALRQRQIKIVELSELIAGQGFNIATKVTTGYGQTYRETKKNTIGFGEGYSAIYFDYTEQVVDHIWLTGHFRMDKPNLKECLLQIGNKWDLILMDWNQTLPIDLMNSNDIEKYLTQ